MRASAPTSPQNAPCVRRALFVDATIHICARERGCDGGGNCPRKRQRWAVVSRILTGRMPLTAWLESLVRAAPKVYCVKSDSAAASRADRDIPRFLAARDAGGAGLASPWLAAPPVEGHAAT